MMNRPSALGYFPGQTTNLERKEGLQPEKTSIIPQGGQTGRGADGGIRGDEVNSTLHYNIISWVP